jgi:hypothetical protein
MSDVDFTLCSSVFQEVDVGVIEKCSFVSKVVQQKKVDVTLVIYSF